MCVDGRFSQIWSHIASFMYIIMISTLAINHSSLFNKPDSLASLHIVKTKLISCYMCITFLDLPEDHPTLPLLDLTDF